MFKYLAFISIVPVTKIFFDRFNTKVLKASVVLWWIVSNLQFILKKPIVGFLLPRASYSVLRSWTIGFAPETGYLAKTSVFFLLLLDAFTLEGRINKNEAIILKILCFWMILLSYSLTGFFLLLIYILISTFVSITLNKISKISLRKLIIMNLVVLLIFGSIPFILNFITKIIFDTQGRLWSFLRNIYETKSFTTILFEDPSFKARFSQIMESLSNFESFQLFGNIPDYPIGSLFSPFLDSGLFGLLLVLLIILGFISSIAKSRKIELKLFTLKLLIIFTFMTFSESLATSYIPAILGVSLYFKDKGIDSVPSKAKSRIV